MRLVIYILLGCLLLTGCGSADGSRIVKPRYHRVLPVKGKEYRINWRIGNRHIKLFKRQRTKMIKAR
ncbi:MAG: hypothetical protein ACK5DD_17050 [Cyclobacteriaceae bacterium]|jgi:hypothetical protein